MARAATAGGVAGGRTPWGRSDAIKASGQSARQSGALKI